MTIRPIFDGTRGGLILVIWIAVLSPFYAVRAEVAVAVGPTTIPRGDAIGDRDITVSNDLFAIAFAVDTAPPWGVARGGIIDIAILDDGIPGYDFASLADFMPNRWSSWPTSYQRVTVEEAATDVAVIKTVRDWGDVELETTFHIRHGDSKIHIVTRMTNKGNAALEDLQTGYVAWPDGGSLFGMPGLHGVSTGDESEALADWSASYDERWALGLHTPFSAIVERAGRDRYLLHDLQPGATKTFEAWLQVEQGGTLAPLVEAEIGFRGYESGRLLGRVSSNDGESVAQPAVVVLKDGGPYAWTLGEDGDYAITLPVGDYEAYATARGFAQSATRKISITKAADTRLDFDDVQPPGTIRFRVANAATGQPLDARISIRSGHKPLIGYFGKNTFFTELAAVGELTEDIAPGSYVFEISAGGGFTSLPLIAEAAVKSGKTRHLRADIAVTAAPHERGWYSADLHHHSDVLDGFTAAEFVMRSELAAGVDITFLSDHDSVVNNREMQRLAGTRDRLFIPGAELSPSWAHFNAYPLDDDKTVDIDTGQATVQEIFGEARRMGADVLEVNHPYSNYGYFENLDKGAVPGGFDAGFDLVEIAPVSDNERMPAKNLKTIRRVWQLWNEGQRAYLAAGSDVHDVWKFVSGRARTYVHVDGELSVDKFIAALKAGKAFASQGPLVYPEILFGSELRQRAGDTLILRYSVQAVNGLRSVQLIERGAEAGAQAFAGEVRPVPVEFRVMPETDTWYSLVVEDREGRSAYTNPVWVTVARKDRVAAWH